MLSKDKKGIFCRHEAYLQCSNKESAGSLEDFLKKNESKYPYAIRSWEENWRTHCVF
jgi:transposase-like protein